MFFRGVLMSNFTISLDELIYCVTCHTCGRRFYLKVEPDDGIPSNAEILMGIEGWDCSDHPHEDQIKELQLLT